MIRRLAVAAGAVGAAALLWGTVLERQWYAARTVTVPVLPGGWRPLRVLHVSDLHLLPWQDRKLRFVQDCRGLRPDLVVATGDLLGHPDAVAPVVSSLGRLADGLPAVAVLGSNDFHAPTPRNPLGYFFGPSRQPRGELLDTEALRAGLSGHGWRVLENERACLSTESGEVDVVGLGDPHIDRDAPEEVPWALPPPGTALRLGLVHAPYRRALDALLAHDADLLLAGHTHGGQVRVPGIGALVANCDLPARQARGLSRHRAAWLHVSAGLGTSRYAPVRFACRPEATLLELVPRTGS